MEEKEPTLYELLGVGKDATPAQLKKGVTHNTQLPPSPLPYSFSLLGYYLQARKFHPDKNPNDPRAEEMVHFLW